MIDAAGLTVEQQQALTTLVAALYDVERLLKSSTVPRTSSGPGA
jgi:hypothetical protein